MADDYTLDLQSRRVQLAEQREARFQRAADARERSGRGSGARRAASAPSRAASSVTSYSGNRMLAAELLAGFVIVAIRVVADYEVQDDGTTKGKVLHPDGQYGPLPILCGLVMTFFVLSFVAAGGGTRAKLAVILGGCIVLTLGVKSYTEIEKVGGTIGKIGSIVVPDASGSESSGASATNSSSSSSSTAKAPAAAAPKKTGSAVSNAESAAQNALKGAENVEHQTALQTTEDLAKSLVDEGTAAADQITAKVKDAFDYIKGLF